MRNILVVETDSGVDLTFQETYDKVFMSPVTKRLQVDSLIDAANIIKMCATMDYIKWW